MKPPAFEYHRPETLGEAVELKAQYGEEATLLAGGQSLIPLLNMRLARPPVIVDLNSILDLQYVQQSDEGLAIGAMTRQRMVEESELVRRECPLLHEALGFVAHAVIRNRGTVGGSVAHADPAAELPAVLVAARGRVVLQGPVGQRRIPAEEFFVGPFSTAIEADEILIGVEVPPWAPGAGSAFVEVSRRHGDFALAGVAAVVVDGEARLAISGVGGRPILVDGHGPEVAASAVEPTDDIHASAEYRRELVAVLAERAVRLAQERSS